LRIPNLIYVSIVATLKKHRRMHYMHVPPDAVAVAVAMGVAADAGSEPTHNSISENTSVNRTTDHGSRIQTDGSREGPRRRWPPGREAGREAGRSARPPPDPGPSRCCTHLLSRIRLSVHTSPALCSLSLCPFVHLCHDSCLLYVSGCWKAESQDAHCAMQ
jgi:hypothetical protein